MLSARIETGELAELAARAARRHVRLLPRSLPRLAEQLAGTRAQAGQDGESTVLATDIRFAEGPDGFPRMHLRISGELPLECRRCLEPVVWRVDLVTSLTVLSDEAQASQLEDPFDSVLLDADGLDIEVVVEDEILAAMPIAPVHGSESECMGLGRAGAESELDAAQTHRPFADLAFRMKHVDQNSDD